jgi:L-alanine-DL-glutamate epimerase-like enolase superfamily enzyme
MSTVFTPATTRIDSVGVLACTIPTESPESDGTLEWNETTIVIVEAKSHDVSGIGYTYADPGTAVVIDRLLRRVVEQRDAMDVAGSWMAMRQAVRNLGGSGLAAMAVSAVDIALWDLKARILRLPLVKLLGAVREGIPVYASGGFTSYSIDQLQRQLSGWIRSGIGMVKMKVGRHPEKDLERVARAREAIGPEAGLFVDANGAYRRRQALELAHRFREAGVRWLEEPVSSDDLEGLRLIRDKGPDGMEIAAGEYG